MVRIVKSRKKLLQDEKISGENNLTALSSLAQSSKIYITTADGENF